MNCLALKKVISQVISLKQTSEVACNIPCRNATKESQLTARLCVQASVFVYLYRKGVLERLNGEIEDVCLNSQEKVQVRLRGVRHVGPTTVCVYVFVSEIPVQSPKRTIMHYCMIFLQVYCGLETETVKSRISREKWVIKRYI